MIIREIMLSQQFAQLTAPTIGIISTKIFMLLFSIKKISKDDRALIYVLHQEKN